MRFISILVLTVLGGCKARPRDGAANLQSSSGANKPVTYQSNADGEIIPSDEEAIFSSFGKFVMGLQATRRAARTTSVPLQKEVMRRGFHPKSHACVKAKFEVASNLSSELSQGLFKSAAGKSMDAWVRFSNGNPVIQPDFVFDFRGFAVKVLNVPTGGRILEAPSATREPSPHETIDRKLDTTSQDFLSLSLPYMDPGTGPTFFDFTKAAMSPQPTDLLNYLVTKPSVVYFTAKYQMFRNIFSMRATSFFSDAAFKHGNDVVKYKFAPCQKINVIQTSESREAHYAYIQQIFDTVTGLPAEDMKILAEFSAYLKTRKAIVDKLNSGNPWIERFDAASIAQQKVAKARVDGYFPEGIALAQRGEDRPLQIGLEHGWEGTFDETMRMSYQLLTKAITKQAVNKSVAGVGAFFTAVGGAWAKFSPEMKNLLRADLVEAFRNNEPEICYDLLVQFPPGGKIVAPAKPSKLDFDDSLIENAEINWQSPFQKVATITFPPTTDLEMGPIGSTDGVRIPPLTTCLDPKYSIAECNCESLKWSPFNGLAEHRPLGSINRVRKAVYNNSQVTRQNQKASTPGLCVGSTLAGKDACNAVDPGSCVWSDKNASCLNIKSKRCSDYGADDLWCSATIMQNLQYCVMKGNLCSEP